MRLLLLATMLLMAIQGTLGLAQEPIPTDFKSAEVNAEIKKLPELEATLRSLVAARMRVARSELIDKLKEYQTKATQDGDLDEALKVRSTIEALEKQQAAEEKVASKDDAKPAKVTIPRDAVRFGKSRYYVVTTPTLKADALKFCEERGGHLARIESAEEHAFCAQLIQPLRNSGLRSWAFVDGDDTKTKGTYLFSNGEPVTYLRWDKKKPTGRADCRFLLLYSETGLYYDGEDKPAPFICEWDLSN